MSRRIKVRARPTDPQTSWQAANSVTNLRHSQLAVLSIVERYGPITDEAIYRKLLLPMSTSGARTRRKELVDLGRVRDSGLRGTTVSGRKTIMWEVVDDGD